MISYEEFKEIVVNKLGRDISSNEEQNRAISSNKDQSLFIVAGPGSGKTTVMVLKILKFIFVDNVAPSEILATTFTKKAANELLSRILSWGDEIKKEILRIAMDKSLNGEIDNIREVQSKINHIDFNQIITGTIDSVAEELLRVHRDPGTNQPVVIEEFVANSAMISAGLFKDNRYLDKNLQEYLAVISGKSSLDNKPVLANPSKMSEVLIDMKNRIYYDQVDFNELLKNTKERGEQLALKAIGDYMDELKERNILDFPMLESKFLNRLKNTKLDIFLNNIKIILIDEYQDTNLMQENIYFTIAKSAIANGGNITVVGDDDQSLYRFRGATVDLFTNFAKRAEKYLNTSIKEINLTANYRSTEDIVNLCNHFVEIDDNYQSARVKEKPKISYSRTDSLKEENYQLNFNNKSNSGDVSIEELKEKSNSGDVSIEELKEKLNSGEILVEDYEKILEVANKNGDILIDDYEKALELANKKFQNKSSIPVLGMFRNNQEILANDLSKLIRDLVKGKEVKLKVKRVLNENYSKRMNSQNPDNLYASKKMDIELAKNKGKISLKLDEEKGSPSDIAILTYSPKELYHGSKMFPYYIKKNLSKFKEPIDIFNPRGQDIQAIEPVAIFCGLMLECIDPEARFQKLNKKIPKLAIRNMNKWRKIAYEFIELSPEPNSPVSLKDFVDHWKVRSPFNRKFWPERASLIELAYKLISWVNELQDDIEGLVYLESITQTITQTGFFNEFSANIYFDDDHILEQKSVEEALWNIFIPIAIGGVSIDENLFETLPSNRVNIMSIHQSKGLEFPLVVVDVGSRFDKNKAKQSILRFPKLSDKSSILEDKIRNESSLGKASRSPKDRAFDDLTRLYFVAFSRAQDVLLLVGLNQNIDGYMTKDKHMNIPNIALGWNRDEKFIGFEEIYLI